MNNEINIEGAVYIETESESCDQCAFQDSDGDCSKPISAHNILCSPLNRADGRSIIFMEKHP